MESFEWSTPARRSGNRELSLIPSEIYLEIFSYFEPSDEITETQCRAMFSSLVFVCRYFCSVALPRLYRSVEIRGRKRQNAKEDPVSSLKFCLEINKGSSWACDLASSVRDCTFEDWIPETPSQEPLYAEFLRVYCKTMVKMEEINSLTLDSVIISHRLLKSIAKLSKLKRLVVRQCELGGDVTQADISALRSLPIEEFTLVTTLQRSANSVRLFQGIPNTSGVILHARKWNGSSMSSMMNSQLTRLTLETASYETKLPQLAHVLNHLPLLTHLKIATLSLDRVGAGHPAFALEPSSLPRLRVLACPPFLAVIFPKRALNEIDLTGYNIPANPQFEHVYLNIKDEDIQTMGQTTAAIHTLSIPGDMLTHGDSIIRHFPDLRKLRVTYADPFSERMVTNKDMGDILKYISFAFRGRGQGFLAIREFKAELPLMKAWVVDLQAQRKAIIAQIEAAFFQVTRVDLGGGVQWYRNDLWSDWQAYVQPAKIEDTLLPVMALFSDNITDYKRCFAKAGLRYRD